MAEVAEKGGTVRESDGERERGKEAGHGIQFRIFCSKGDFASGKHNERSGPSFSLPPTRHPSAVALSRNRTTPWRVAFRVKTAEYSCLDIVKPHFRHYHYVKHVVEADKSNNGARSPQTCRVRVFSTIAASCSRSNFSPALFTTFRLSLPFVFSLAFQPDSLLPFF